jgi:hypothetical protein
LSLWFRSFTGFGQSFIKHIVGVAIAPILARFERLYYGVSSGVKMLRRMTVGRIVTASDVAANFTKPKVQPMSAYFQTVFTAISTGFNSPDFAYVLAILHFTGSF